MTVKICTPHPMLAGSTLATTFALVAPAHAQASYLQEQSLCGQCRAFSGAATVVSLGAQVAF